MPQIKRDEILTKLTHIEDKVDELRFSSISMWLAAFGFGLIINLVPIAQQDLIIRWWFGGVGLLLILIARLMLKPKKRPQKT